MRSDVKLTATAKPKSKLLTINIQQFQVHILDRYNRDPTKYITVPNLDFQQTFQGAVEPSSKTIRVYHTNAKRLEKVGLASAFNLKSHVWSVSDLQVVKAADIDPTKKI